MNYPLEAAALDQGAAPWSVPGVPHRGWTCIDVEDLEEPSEICGMCRARTIRYVHVMRHPDHPGEIRAGCVCAGHMEGDYAAPAVRERKLRNRLRKRAVWCGSPRWKCSKSGNPWRREGVLRVGAYLDRDGRWGIYATMPADVYLQRESEKWYGSERYATADAAKSALFDALERRRQKVKV